MAILQSTDELEKYVGNKYSLVILAAKRARQIKEGHTPLAVDKSPNPLTLALREVAEERLQAIAPTEEEIAPAPRDMITSLVSGAGFDLDEEVDLEDGDAVEDLAALLMGADEDEEEEAETDEEGAAATGEADAEDAEDAEDEETSDDADADADEETEDEEGLDMGDEEEEETEE
ncbi:MAG TPA: DNA-directed RNA polymerase subunit omega [Armatimonadota bacterium]|nr:DNA-directed RNA polymerase subunit omega [Armatimonadota bacterium]